MKYCNHCSKITTGEALFCNFCGRSYDVKLCPSKHPNPRAASVCAQCGSRELSTPHPKTPALASLLLALLPVIPGIALLGATLMVLIAALNTIANNGEVQIQLFLGGLVAGLGWLAYMHLPQFLKSFVTKTSSGSKKKDSHGH